MFRIDGHVGFQRDSLSTDFPCGTRYERDSNGLARQEVRLYNAYASAIPAYQPCLVRYDGDEETNPYVISGSATSGTAIFERVVVPQTAVPASSWGWFTIAGYCTALVEGTDDVAKDDYLQFAADTLTGLVKEAAISNAVCGIARAAQAANSAVATEVYLLGERTQNDES